jgi:hypothetical protein
MSQSSELFQIGSQEVYELVLARNVVTPAGEDPSLVHLWWRAPLQGDRLTQVYLDGRLIDVTLTTSQRELWIACDRSVPHRVDLLAVRADDPEQLWRDRSAALQSLHDAPASRATLAIARDPTLPVDTMLHITLDDHAMHSSPLWAEHDDRSGLGASLGIASLGTDLPTGHGLGSPVSELGFGPLGTDGVPWRWQSDELITGSHTLSLTATDRLDRPVAEPITRTILTHAPPSPPRNLQINSNFVLSWTD